MEAETTGKHSGRPLSEKEYAEWQRAFSEIEEVSASLAKKGKKAYNDIEASIAYCIKHSCQVKKSKV